MKRTIIVCSYNRPIQDATRRALGELTTLGALFFSQFGTADVALARNLALTGAMQTLRAANLALAEERKKDPDERASPGVAPTVRDDFDTILMIDDDMLFSAAEAQQLIDHTRETGRPASAMYATASGTLAAVRLKTPAGERQRWVTGLGLLAIPALKLSILEAVSERFNLVNGEHTAFTESTCRDGSWFSEDFTLCARLGGVHLLPIGVGHLKTVPIYPDEETIRCIAEGRALPTMIPEKVLNEIEPSSFGRFARNADGSRG